jgi:hypothetical protein
MQAKSFQNMMGNLIYGVIWGEFHDYKWDMTNLMNALVLCHIQVPPLGIRCVSIVSTINFMLHDNFYEVIVGCYPTCTCIDFISMLASSIGKEGKYVSCKHLYFIYAKRTNCNAKKFFIHQPTLNWNAIHRLL